MIGFDDLGGAESFTTKQLEERLSSHSRTEAYAFSPFTYSFFLLGIFQVFGKFKVSADRRDITESSDDE